MNNTYDTRPDPIPGVRPGQEKLYHALVRMHASTPSLPKLRPLAPAVPSTPLPKLLRLPNEVVLPKAAPRPAEQLVVARQTRDGVLRLVRDGRRGLGLTAFSVVLALIALLR